MLVLYESAAGYALFKLLDESKLDDPTNMHLDFRAPESAAGVLKLLKFKKFTDTTEAVAAATAAVESKLSKGLKSFLKKNAKSDTLAVADTKLGAAIKDKLKIHCEHSDATMELQRGIRRHFEALVGDVTAKESTAYKLGLAHSLSRYKLKFSPDKVDTMIVQAINLLDELDKENNIYAMRVREWFGWHFPEMGKIVTDNVQYAKCILKMKTRTTIQSHDFSDILTDEVEAELKTVAEVSMGVELSEFDALNIISLCKQVVRLTEYRTQLYEYLKNRMNAIAPNLTVLVGELVGARLIAHAGSLLNLAKQPASTVQILGAEKALFRALKTKGATPKYGLIYHASLIGQTAPKMKGKISRVLAAKAALAIRVDALGDEEGPTVGIEGRNKVEARIRQLEGKGALSASGKASKSPAKKYSRDTGAAGSTSGAATGYSAAADAVLSSAKKRKRDDSSDDGADAGSVAESATKKKKKKKKSKKEKKEKKRKAEELDDAEEPSAKKAKKEKKKKKMKKKKKDSDSD